MRRDLKELANRPGTVGIEIVLSIALPFFVGRWLDGRFGTAPWIQVTGFLLGCAAAVRAVVRAAREMREVARREEEVEGNPRPMFPRDEDKPEKTEQGEQDESR